MTTVPPFDINDNNAEARQAIVAAVDIAVARALWSFEGLIKAGVPRNDALNSLAAAMSAIRNLVIERSGSLEVSCTGSRS